MNLSNKKISARWNGFTAQNFIPPGLLTILFLISSFAEVNAHSILGTPLQQTTDGGYIITGGTNSFGAGNFDVYLIKTDADGNTLWTKTYGGSDYDAGFSVKQTTDGGYIVAGVTYSFGAGLEDVYLIKTDVNGDTLWTKTYGGSSTDYAWSVQQTADGGYIVAGVTGSYGAGSYDVYLIKTDANGNTLWTKTYGGSNYDSGNFVQKTTDDGYIVAGITMSYGAGSADVYLIKTNSVGDTLWTKTYGGVNWDESNSVQQTIDGGYILAGYTNSFGSGLEDVYLIKTDSIGDTLWIKTYGGSNGEISYSVEQTTDGGYIVAGVTLSYGAGNIDVYLIKTDTNGDILWTKTYGENGIDESNYVQQTIDGGFIVAGHTNSFGTPSIYLIKTNTNGNSECSSATTGTLVANTATLLSSGAMIGSGAVVNNTATIVSNTATIDVVFCNTCMSPAAAFGYMNSLLTVSFSDSSIGATSWLWDFGDGNTDTLQNPQHTYPDAGSYLACLTVTNDCGTDTMCKQINIDTISVGIQKTELENAINIYPNPFNTTATLQINSTLLKKDRNMLFIFYDIYGQEVARRVIPGNEENLIIEKGNLPNGIYFYKIINDQEILGTGKIIITF